MSGRSLALACACAAIACRSPAVEAPAPPREGIAVALYLGTTGKGFGIVDDRRWIEVAEHAFVLDRIANTVELSSLILERIGPHGVTRLDVDTCTRDRLADALLSPLVRCTTSLPPGRHLVRVLYVSSDLTYEPRHEITVTGERATISTRYTIATPRWRITGDVTLYDGVPGDPGRDQTPRAVGKGAITLDGGITTLLAAPRELRAALRTIFDGAVRDPDDDPTRSDWRDESRPQVMTWLELDGPLAIGRAVVRVTTPEGEREIAIPANARDRVGGKLRLPLWVERDLGGHRDRAGLVFEADSAIEEVDITISNHGGVRREVWIEERLRPNRRRSVRARRGDPPTLIGNVARHELVVAPGQSLQVVYLVDYGPL